MLLFHELGVIRGISLRSNDIFIEFDPCVKKHSE